MSMSELEALFRLCQRDRRYRLEAYVFVNDAIVYAQQVLKLGEVRQSEDDEKSAGEKSAGPSARKSSGASAAGAGSSSAGSSPAGAASSGGESSGGSTGGKHVTGQQLCEAIRLYALEQYGYLAKPVFNSWGLYSTSDFGNIVYNMIEIRLMRKTKEDRREDFDDVFDFETGLRQSFRFEPLEAAS